MSLIHGVDCRLALVENRFAFELQCRCHESVVDDPFLRHDGDAPHLRLTGKALDHLADALRDERLGFVLDIAAVVS